MNTSAARVRRSVHLALGFVARNERADGIQMLSECLAVQLRGHSSLMDAVKCCVEKARCAGKVWMMAEQAPDVSTLRSVADTHQNDRKKLASNLDCAVSTFSCCVETVLALYQSVCVPHRGTSESVLHLCLPHL